MAVANLPNYDIGSIVTPEQGLELIRQNLIMMKDIAENTNFAIPAECDAFFKNIAFIKQYYERVDYLLAMRGE